MTDISDEELDAFLEAAERGANTPQQTTKDLSLEKILEELMEGVKPNSSQTAYEDPIPPLLLEKGLPLRKKIPLLPLWLTSAFLGGIFLGSLFGFQWGKTQKVEPEIHTTEFVEIEAKLNLLLEEMQKLRAIPPAPPESLQEIIEPFESPSLMELLDPSSIQ